MIGPKFRNINGLFFQFFKVGNNDPTRNCFINDYMPLVEITDFNALIDNKLFFKQPIKTNKKRMKSFSKCHETMTLQQETYDIICTVKNIINSLIKIYHDKQIQVFRNKLIS